MGTNLKLSRQKLKATQEELVDASGVPIRTIQQYEQRQKNISKVQVEYLVKLTRILCSDIEGVLDKVV